VVVVTGHEAVQVQKTVTRLGVRTVHNRVYASGEMLSSLQTGLKALPATISACMVVLGDQPQISPRLVNDLLIAYAEGRGSIVAPSYNQRRGHPILIDRRYWQEMLDLPLGSAPRDVINQYPQHTAYVVTQDENILRDMDTPEEYQEALRRAGLL
jgi:molybdenum cofactor cytidylyltransferase